MTLNSRFADVLHAAMALGSNKATLLVAAVCCAGGLATAGVLITNGTISLENLRQSAATVGTDETEVAQIALPDEAEQPAGQSEILESGPEGEAEPQKTVSLPTFDIVRVEPDGNAVLAGLAAPGNQIEIMSGDQVLARAYANSAGEWALVLDEPLSVGGHQIAVRSISSDAEEPLISVQNVTVSVPEQAVESAIVMLDEPGEPSTIWQSPATVIRPETPEQSAALTDVEPLAETNSVPSASVAEDSEGDVATDSPDSPDSVVEPTQPDRTQEAPLVTVEAVETDGAEDLLVSGASRPNASVRLFLDNKLVGETVAGPVGRWQMQTDHSVPKGRLLLRVEQVHPSSGAVLARREVPFERDPEIVGSLAATFDPDNAINDDIRGDIASGRDTAQISGVMSRSQRVVVGKGDNLWTIARRIYGSGVRYTTLYSANEDQIRNPATVFPDQVLLIPDEDSLAN